MRLLLRVSAILVCAVVCLAPTASWADLAPYSQDFEGLSQPDPDALANDGWLVFGNVFGPGGAPYLYGYGPFPAPNGGQAFSAIVPGPGDPNPGGPGQGAQQLSVYSDYNNTDHGLGRAIESNVFQERTIGAADVGQTYVFEFDAARGNIELATTALAFIKTLDPNAGFALTNFITLDMTGVPSDWGSYSLSIYVDAGLQGQILQFGFANTATNYEGSGVFYDNVNFRPWVPYSQDFEDLVQTFPGALAGDGWLVFGNVFGPGGSPFLYGYGPFPAPNGGPGFCGIDVNQGGIPQGDQQLVVYNDYNNQDHALGRLIEANVFQERTIGNAEIGKTFLFEFDAKRGNIEGASTALAFIKTLDPNAGFQLTNFITVDMTNIPITWGSYSLEIDVDAGLAGQILQFGFLNTATFFEGSGIFYDNVNFREKPISVSLDIKPRSCPNPICNNSKALLPVAVLGTADFDVNDIDVLSLRLEGVPPIDFGYDDVAAPFTGTLCGCSTAGPDGFLDLTLSFKTQQIINALGPGLGDRTLTLTGTLLDGTPIEGLDCAVILSCRGRPKLQPLPNPGVFGQRD